MGGYGSGRTWGSTKARVEECRTLEIGAWRRQGLLRPGSVFTTTWSRGERVLASITSTVAEDCVTLSYYRTGLDGVREPIEYRVALTWTACNYGGRRPWFVCPGMRNTVPCKRRVGKLYLLSRYFLCRHCHDLTFESRVERRHNGGLRRAQAIRRRLGGSASMIEPFPRKPRGMHWRTYRRLRGEHDIADLRYLLESEAYIASMLERLARGRQGHSGGHPLAP